MAKKQDQQKGSQVPSVKNVDIEQPLKGMNQDMSAQAQPDGTYRFALNAVNNTEEGQQGYLSTEEGNFDCIDFDHNPTVWEVNDINNISDPPVAGDLTALTLFGAWRVIGHIYTGENKVIIFLTGSFQVSGGSNKSLSRIIEFNIDSCETNILLTSDCLDFTIEYQIQGVHRIRKGCERNIYFTDNNNEPRQMNLDSLDNYLELGVPPVSVWDSLSGINFESIINIWDCEKFRLFTLVGAPHIDYINTDDSGGVNMKPGVYQICIRYLDGDLNPTRFFDICNPIPIYADRTESNNINFNDIQGTHTYTLDDDGTVSTGRLTTKSIRYTFSRLDTSYEYVDVVAIPSTTGTGMNDGIAYIVDTIPIIGQTSVNYRFRGIDPDTAKEITLEEILIPNIGYEKAKTIEQSENRLILGNVTSNAIDHAKFQKAALNITSRYITKTVHSNSKTNTPKGGQYYFDGRSYMRDEVYSFAIVWMFKDGSESPAYHIPGRAMDVDSSRSVIGNQDINHPASVGYNPNLGAEHNRELSINAAVNTGSWDSAAYATPANPIPDHNHAHLAADNNGRYERWRVYNTAIRDQVSFNTPGNSFLTEGEMAYWESGDYVYPDLKDCDGNPIYEITYISDGTDGNTSGDIVSVEDLTGQPVRHHKMPDTTLEPHFYGNQTDDPNCYPNTQTATASAGFLNSEKISILGVKFDNVLPPTGVAYDGVDWDQKIQGYKIVKQERNDFDKSVLDKGIIYYNYQAKTYSKGGTLGGDAQEMCNGDGFAGTDQNCWFWFQGNSYNKHLGLMWGDDQTGTSIFAVAISQTLNQPDRNPFSTIDWNQGIGNWSHFEPSLLVPSGCDSVGAANPGAGSCRNGTTCGWCETWFTGCIPYANIEWGGTDWNGGQDSGWASWSGWPFHNPLQLTVGDCSSPANGSNPTPNNTCSDLPWPLGGCNPLNLPIPTNPGFDIRHNMQGSYTNNISYHGPLTKFTMDDPNPTHIKIERVFQGRWRRKHCKQNHHMTGCNPNQDVTGQQPDGSFIASVCRYTNSVTPYYNISQAINGVNSAFSLDNTNRLFLGHFSWPNHPFPLASRSIMNSFKVGCQERVNGRLADNIVRSFDNCKQGDTYVIELDGGTAWSVGNFPLLTPNPLGWGMPFPGNNGSQFGYTNILNDNSNISKCSDGNDSLGMPTSGNAPAAANINMLTNNIISTCNYVSLKRNNPSQYGPVLSAIYIPSSNNLTYRDDATYIYPTSSSVVGTTTSWVTTANNTINPNADLTTVDDYNGDSFISRFAFRKHGHFKKCGGQRGNINNYRSSQVAYLVSRQTPYFWVESSINTDLRHGGFAAEEQFYPYDFEGNRNNTIIDNWYDKEGLYGIQAVTDGVRESMGWDGIDNSMGYGWPGDYPVMCEQYNYNKDYSKINNENKYFGLPLGFDYCSDCYTNFPHRIIYSVQAFQEETADNFRVFTSESYTDIPGHRGDITNIFTFNSKLYTHTAESLWLLFTSQETLQTNEGTEVSLGTGDFLSKPPREIIESETGYGGSISQWANLKTSQGVFFVDAADGKIFLLGEKLQNISKAGMSNWFEENIPFSTLNAAPNFTQMDNPANPVGVGYILALDEDNHRFIVTKKDYRPAPGSNVEYVIGLGSNPLHGEWRIPTVGMGGYGPPIAEPYKDGTNFENLSWTASYSLLTGAWTSFHSYLPTTYITGKDTFVSIINRVNTTNEGKHGIFKEGVFQDNYLLFYGYIEKFIIDTISTTNPLITEVYDNYHFHSKAKEYDTTTGQWRDLRNITFDQVILYNDYQCTELLNFNKRIDNKSNMMGSIQNNPGELLLDIKERVWGFNGFRDMIIDRTRPMFTSNWADINNDYFIDKVLNLPTFTGTRNWNERQKFRDKYLGIRLIFSNLAGTNTTSIPKITFNYLQSGMTRSSR